MRSKQRPEKLKLIVDPKERSIFGVRETASGPGFGIGAERRSDGAGPETDLHDDGGERPRRRALPMVVALVALAGFAVMVWYAFDWGLDQVETGRLPVILAEPEPIKSRPESPGGLEVPHQDKLVLNEVVPDPEKPQVERLLPPPETPRPPKAPSAAEVETAAGALDEPTRSAVPPAPLPVPESAVGEAPAAAAPQIPAAASSPPSEPALSEPADAPPQVAAQPAAPETAAPETATAEPATAEPATPEPATPEPAAAAMPAPPVQTAARTASGTYVVQLAALRARDGTRPAWTRLQRAHPMLLGDKELTVQEIDLGERGIFYRVQAGFFPDRVGASALCRALKARQQDCLVVKR